jgi:hypothetical protein
VSKREMVEWMKTPGFAKAIDALRFLSRRALAQFRRENVTVYLERAKAYHRSANALILESRAKLHTAPRKVGP